MTWEYTWSHIHERHSYEQDTFVQLSTNHNLLTHDRLIVKIIDQWTKCNRNYSSRTIVVYCVNYYFSFFFNIVLAHEHDIDRSSYSIVLLCRVYWTCHRLESTMNDKNLSRDQQQQCARISSDKHLFCTGIDEYSLNMFEQRLWRRTKCN
jgi:hypothetical protein